MRLATALAALGLATAALVPACQPRSAPSEAGGSAKASADAGESQILARVGDRAITLGDYVAALNHLDEFDRLRYAAPERRKDFLDEMIDVMLLADEAREKGYDKEPLAQQELREILRDAMLKKAREGSPVPNAIPEGEVRAYYEAHGDNRLPRYRGPGERVAGLGRPTATRPRASCAPQRSGGQAVRRQWPRAAVAARTGASGSAS